jgi:DNA-binding winged helix-turn-helix (wHTH) protein/class 3 adenylate cyclase
MMMPALAQHRGATSTDDAPKRPRRTNEPFHSDALQEFGPFLLDPMNEQVRRGGQPVALTPRAFSVLSYLAAHANRLVTKNELLDHVWAGVFVGDAALKVCIREIRKALGDDPDAPQYIETAHRRGYRFIAPVFQRGRNREPSDHVLPAASPRAAQPPVEGRRISESLSAEQSGTALRSGRQSGQTREIHYARSGDTNIAFQVLGDGPFDLVFVMEKTRALVMFGTYAKRVWDPDYPWAPTAEQRERFYREIRDQWGGPVGIDDRAPSRAADPMFRDWWAGYLRMGASPGAALTLTRMNTQVDVRHVLPAIRVPSLIIHRRGDRCLKVEEGRYVADRITGARFVELPGEDHLPFVGDQDALLDQIEEFVTGVRNRSEPDRVLATVLSAHIHGPAQSRPGAAWRTPIDDYLAYARRQIQWYRGRDLAAHVNGFVTAFDGPARAIRCATALSTAAANLGIQVSVGLHTGECDALDDSIAGVAVEIGMQVSAQAAVGEVLVSRTVTDLVAGSGIHFSDRGIHRLGGVAGEWRLFGVG